MPDADILSISLCALLVEQYAELKAAIESIVNDAHDFYGGGPEGPFKV